MIRFNANLFRLATTISSTEESRYYLRGVYVEPHAQGGVTLTATDGRRLIVIHDESGSADEKAIIKLGDALKQCKAKRGMKRDVVVETGSNEATILEGVDGPEAEMSPVAKALDVRIDGTYPDYRRVVPSSFAGTCAPSFNGEYLGTFGEIGNALSLHFGKSKIVPMQVLPGNGDTSSPALIRWSGIESAFGILMPMRGTEEYDAPAWFRAPVTAPSVAPETSDEQVAEAAE